MAYIAPRIAKDEVGYKAIAMFGRLAYGISVINPENPGRYAVTIPKGSKQVEAPQWELETFSTDYQSNRNTTH